jgi:hypothetical protein
MRCISLYAIVFFFVVSIGFPMKAHSQDSLPPQVDLRDKLRQWFYKKPKKEEFTMEQGKLYKAFLPIIGYTPAYGFLIGTGVSASMLLGDPGTTNISTALANVNFTTKDQIVINLRTNITTKNNNWVLQGDYRMLFYSQPTYGLGTYFNNRPPLHLGDTSYSIPPGRAGHAIQLFQVLSNLQPPDRTFFLPGSGV